MIRYCVSLLFRRDKLCMMHKATLRRNLGVKCKVTSGLKYCHLSQALPWSEVRRDVMNAHKKSFLWPHIYQGAYQKYIFDAFTKIKKTNHMNNKHKIKFQQIARRCVFIYVKYTFTLYLNCYTSKFCVCKYALFYTTSSLH